jgi:hypothetical protein
MSYMSHLPFVTVTPPSSWQRRALIPTMSRHQLNPTKRQDWERERKFKQTNYKVAKKDVSDPDLQAAHQSNDAAVKEDDQKPAAVAKKMDDTTPKLKHPPPKRVDKEDQTDNKKPAAKENVQHKKKRRNAKLPLHPNSTPLLPKLIGKSPNMDLDLEDTESESDNEILEDKAKPWKLITTLKEREIRNLKQAAKNQQKKRVQGEVPSG